MLGFLIFYLKGMRIIIFFKFSGFYCMRFTAWLCLELASGGTVLRQ